MPKAKPKDEQVGLEYEDIEKIVEADRNPKAHDIPFLKTLIRRFGFIAPGVKDARSGKLVAGHGRRRALLEMKEAGEQPPKYIEVRDGRWFMPLVCGVSFKTEEDAEDYLLTDNRLVELGGWDPKLMAEFIKGWEPAALKGVGWDQCSLTAVLDAADFDQARRGSTPEDQLPGFNAGAVKQVVVYFNAQNYPEVEARCQKVMKQMKVSTASEMFLGLVGFYERLGLRKKGGRK